MKFTDEQVIKALENRMYRENKHMFLLLENTLNLINRKDTKIAELTVKINRKDAEIENLRQIIRTSDKEQDKLIAEIERLEGYVKTEDEVRTIAKETIDGQIKLIKSEAIKEFIKMSMWFLHYSSDLKSIVVPFQYMKDIEKEVLNKNGGNLVKEMVGETE